MQRTRELLLRSFFSFSFEITEDGKTLIRACDFVKLVQYIDLFILPSTNLTIWFLEEKQYRGRLLVYKLEATKLLIIDSTIMKDTDKKPIFDALRLFYTLEGMEEE